MNEHDPAADPDAALLAQLRAGDPDALEALFERHRPYLRRLAELFLDERLSARVDASDLIQETQLEAFRRIEDYLDEPPMPFRLWLRRMIRDRAGMARRFHLTSAKRSRHREMPLPDRSSALLTRQLLGEVDTPSEQVAKRETAREVRSAVDSLAEADREILTMRTFEKLSFEEIALVIGVRPEAARKRHGRALIRLTRRLEDSTTEVPT